jgi:histidine ammonia-lyase
MGWGAGRKLGDVLANTEHVVAVEVLCAVQGIEQRAPLRPAPLVAEAARRVRTVVAPLGADRPVGPDITAVAGAVREGLFDELLD